MIELAVVAWYDSTMTLDEALEEALRTAAAAWPQIRLDPLVFIAHLRERLLADDEVSELGRLHVADLYLACACLRGDAVAWRELARVHLSRIGEFVGRLDRSSAFADDVRQRLSEKLLADESGRPKLALYTGRGPLGGWLRVAAVREAQNAKRRLKYADDPDELPLAADQHDPEVALLKRKYTKEFETAFQEVLATLSADERNVLRLHYLDGLTIEEVGKAYRVSRATAARWIAKARDHIIERVREQLEERLDQSTASPDSVLAFVHSQLGMSLRRHLS
jgi:RNA polymerase sigma-70 factor, ECF subfamily